MVTYEDRPWVKMYDEGVPASLKPYPDYPLHHFLEEGARKHPDRPLVITGPKRLPVIGRVASHLSYKEVNDLADAFAVALTKLGLKKGDRVAIVMPNSAQFLIAFYATLKAGGVVAATNPTYPPDKMMQQINDCDAEIVVTISLFYNMMVDIQHGTKVKHIIVSNIKEYFPQPIKTLFTLATEKKGGHAITKRSQDHWMGDLINAHKGQKTNVTVSKDDLCLFQYTGGTTGVAKAAMSTHGALVANTLMCKAWLFGSKEAKPTTFLGAIPFFHAFGIVVVVSCSVTIGGSVAIVANAREIDEVLDILTTFKATIFPGVPALYNAINNHPDVKAGKYDLSCVEACFSGSAPLAPATKEEFERLSGGKLVEGFGMSEMPTATHGNPLYGQNRTGSIGLPFPDMEIKVVSLDDGTTILPVGEVGELCMHGPHLMVGYHGMPTETANVLRQDETGKLWLYTGDIARMDEDGYCYIVDRKKDMALIGGFNVYPTNIENALMEHPAVLEAGVAAIPHPEKEGQEALKAWVVKKPDANVTEKDLIEFCKSKMAPYEVPTRFAFTDSLPRTTVGKVLRRELAAMEMAAREKAKS